MIEKICTIINNAFKEPYAPNGFVRARIVSSHYGEPAIRLYIGASDVTFTPDGEVISHGTDFMSKWLNWWAKEDETKNNI